MNIQQTPFDVLSGRGPSIVCTSTCGPQGRLRVQCLDISSPTRPPLDPSVAQIRLGVRYYRCMLSIAGGTSIVSYHIWAPLQQNACLIGSLRAAPRFVCSERQERNVSKPGPRRTAVTAVLILPAASRPCGSDRRRRTNNTVHTSSSLVDPLVWHTQCRIVGSCRRLGPPLVHAEAVRRSLPLPPT